MIKTEMQIERDFIDYVKQSTLGGAIRGGIYRSEMRPDNAATEDLIVKFLTGIDEQIQTGVVIINIYVPDIAFGGNGRKVADKVRIAELQEQIQAFIEQSKGGDYMLSTERTPQAYKIEDIEQHVIAVRLKFKRLSD